MRKKFGKCTIVSGCRHRAYNTIPGAAAISQHIYDETPDSVATDARFATGNSKQWVAHAKTLRAGLGNKGGIGRYDRDRFVHIDNRPSSEDWQGQLARQLYVRAGLSLRPSRLASPSDGLASAR